MDRMFCYLWHEITDLNECKFGERFVFTGQDPEIECRKRIRESLGVRKDKFDEKTVVVDHIWDVSDWASKVGRNKKGGHMDDFIREQIGSRKGTTGEVHSISADDMTYKVNTLLQKVGQPLPLAGLSQNQYWAAENVLEAIEDDKNTIVAELCARFGKTIWSGSLIREIEIPLTIVASYVLTSFTSFKKDLSSFEQFRDLILVDAADEDWAVQVVNGLEAGLQVVVMLSMCNGERRQDRINFLFGQDCRKMLIIDEADLACIVEGKVLPL